MERNYRTYMHIMGKCSRDPNEFNMICEKIRDIAKQYNCKCTSILRDITEETHITYTTIIFMNPKSLDEEKNITDGIIAELEKFACILECESQEKKAEFLVSMDKQINELEKKSIPNFLIIPTYACNLSCTYCYEKSYEIKKVKSDEYKTIIDKQIEFISEIIR